MTLLDQAIKFRRAYGQEMLDGFLQTGFIKKKLFDMQTSLINEESSEFLEACENLDEHPHSIELQTEVLKELSDLVFVCYQFAAAYGLDLDTAMKRVFESNMSKLGEDGKPIYREDGKVLKGPNYFKPMLGDLIPNEGMQYETSGK
jgi:NTP pyrophosphatase (non-canonical NTP hydrolase)